MPSAATMPRHRQGQGAGVRACITGLAGLLSAAVLAQGATPSDECTALSSTNAQCTSALLGNGWCDNACNFAECDQDNKDCECKITADCNTGQSCKTAQALCYVDSTWNKCMETRCNADSDCDTSQSSCNYGHRCTSGSCAYSCDAWCEDTFGNGYTSDGSRTQDGRGNKCVGCVLKESVRVGWIIVGCLVGGVFVAAVIGVLLTVNQKSRAGKAQPVMPVGSVSENQASQIDVEATVVQTIDNQADMPDSDSDSDSDDEGQGAHSRRLTEAFHPHQEERLHQIDDAASEARRHSANPDRIPSAELAAIPSEHPHPHTHPSALSSEDKTFERSAPQFAA